MTYDPNKDSYIAALEKYRAGIADLQSEWTLETVKHLALINIAGMAGATALLQVAHWANRLSIRLALAFFFLGLILAVLDLYLNSLGYWAKLKDADRARLNASRSESSGELARHGVPSNSAGLNFFNWAGATGWLSAILAITGCILIGALLFK